MDKTALETLIEMGFPQNRAEKALSITGNQGTQKAMDWIFEHMDDPDIDEPYVPSSTSSMKLGSKNSSDDASSTPTPMDTSSDGGDSGGGSDQQARSLVCQDCGKKLKSELDAQAHAARTQHQNFAESTDEIKPLTEEEKKAQLARVEQRLKEAKEARIAKEAQEALLKEKARRAQGKDLTLVRKQAEEEEMKKLLEAKKREKAEDLKAKQKIKEMIEQDKLARLNKANPSAAAATASSSSSSSSSSTSTNTPATTTATTTSTTTSATPAPAPAKDYSSASLQIRLFNGQALKHSFDSTSTLQDVINFVNQNRTDGAQPFTFMTNFPKKVFSSNESTMTLKDLNLVPSAVLILTRPL